MKKYLMLSLVLIWMGQLNAQNEEKPRLSKEERVQRFEQIKIAHLTQSLDLSSEQAQAFWPIYNKYTKQKKELRNLMKIKRIEDMTDSEAREFIRKSQETKKSNLKIETNMLEELDHVLSPQQQVKLLRSERNFHKRMVKRFSKDRGHKKDGTWKRNIK